MSAPSQATGFAAWNAFTKLAVWLAAIMATVALAQTGAWFAGWRVNVLLLHGARTWLILLALASVLLIMQWDRRPLSEYGLSLGESWGRHLLWGLAVGVVTYSAYCLLAWLAGGLTPGRVNFAPGRIAAATLGIATAIPVAATQQVIFSGYWFGALRKACPTPVAIVLVALLAAGFGQLTVLGQFLSGETWGLFAGFFAIGVLLGLVRLLTGNIAWATGLLAGWLFVRRFTKKTELFALGGGSEAAFWWAPGGDPRCGPIMWAFVGLGVAVCVLALRRNGEAKAPEGVSDLGASFKRVFPFSNILALAPLDILLPRLVEARFRVPLAYLPRLLFTLVSSTLNTVVTLPERLLAPLLLRRRVPDPVFIVGTFRSGTTHLHYLLSHDRRYCSPRNFHTFNPHGAWLLGWLITPLYGAFMTMRRPMDAVRINLFSPQEEEFAMAGLSRLSPYWAHCFPREVDRHHRSVFLDELSENERAGWRRRYLLFLRKITFWNRKRPLLKSPFNTGRVAELRAMFPRAKFIHIARHPHKVYQSNVRLSREGIVAFQLQDPAPGQAWEDRFLDMYRRLEDACQRDLDRLPAGDVAHVRMEDLEGDPIGEVRRIYETLELEYTPEFHRRLERYLESVSDYKKNRHPHLPEDVRSRIDHTMAPFMSRWGYSSEGERERAA